MNMKEQLNNLGWSINAEFMEHNKSSLDVLKKQLLDSDLRQVGERCLPEISKLEQTNRPYIVQLQKTRNVTAPKDNEASTSRTHLYRLTITDGHIFQNALILPSLRNFNLDTPPGAKILLKAKTKIVNGFYVLNDQTCELLGGTVNELVQKWKLNRLMGKHVRTLIGEGAPPPWVPFGTRQVSATHVDTSKRAMDVAKMQQTNEEDPEFIRQRQAAIDTVLTDQTSKTQLFAQQDVMNAKNVAKCFEQTSQKPKSATAALASLSISSKPVNVATSVEAIKSNSRLPEWAKNQIADDVNSDDKRRGVPDRKQSARSNLDDDDNRMKRGASGRGRQRGGRGRNDDDGGEETRPSKDVTLFDFFDSTKSTSTTQKSSTKSQKPDSKSVQNISAPNQTRISSAVQKQIFEYDNGDQVLARYYEDNEYYPAIIMNVMHDRQKCVIMFEGYDTQNIVNFDDVEPFEEGYYEGEEDEYEEEQAPQRNNPVNQREQSGYGYPSQPFDNRNRPNFGRGYPQQYPNRYNSYQ